MSVEKTTYNKNIIRPHSRKIITQAENIKKKVEKWLFIDEAPKRKLIEGITIDWAWSRDLDDWVWAEKTKFWYTLFISISDVSEYIKINSLIDNYSLKRPSSIYLNTHNYNMIPPILSTGILSLNHHEKTLTQTLEVNFDKNFNIINTNTIETIFYNKNRLNYESFNEKFFNKEDKLYKTLRLLYYISQILKQKRIKAWSNPLFRECISLKLDKDCKQENFNIWKEIISEIAIFKNIIDAQNAYKITLPILYRWFKPELQNKFLWNINTDRWFFNYKPTYHSWFSSLFYTYNTSPIRRYADLINQRQIKAYLRKDKIPYNTSNIRKLALQINSNIEKIIEASKIHNKEVFEKRSKRFIKKLAINNFENISSVSQKNFYYLLKYILEFENNLLKNPKIQIEIIFRIQHNLLWNRCISMLNSTPKTLKEVKIFKEIIKYIQSK